MPCQIQLKWTAKTEKNLMQAYIIYKHRFIFELKYLGGLQSYAILTDFVFTTCREIRLRVKVVIMFLKYEASFINTNGLLSYC